MSLLDSVSALGDLISSNFANFVVSVVVAIVGYLLYKVITRELTRLKDKKRAGRTPCFHFG